MSVTESNNVGRNTPIDQLKPNPLNPREHPDEQVALLARLIEKFGFQSTIQVDENGMILAGHGRVLALQKLNRTEVPA
jgi:ParB-like chromosome segregation protein Spo0J